MSSAESSPPAGRSVVKPRAQVKELPEQFGRYQLRKKLGQGGMGAVYLALDAQLDRQVALKVPHFGPEEGPAVLERFRREAKAAATLHHTNLCPVFDVGEHDGVHFLTMAFIEGKSLAEVLKDGKGLPPRPAAMIVRTLALAIQETHAKGVIHRDLKPSNIMLGPRQEPVIMDFGLARRAKTQDARLTKQGSVMGTPAYMAPEQVKGEVEAMGPGCDIYSLGVILHEMLAGKPPFSGPVMAVLGMVLTQPPEPPSKVRPGLDPALEAICLKAMAKEPGRRYGSMADLAAALGQYLQGVVAPTAITPSPRLAATDVQTATAPKTVTQPLKKQPTPIITLTLPPGRRKRPAAAPAGTRRWLPWVVAGACLLALVAIVLLMVVFRVRTRMGVIVITINEPGAEVYVDDELKVTITSPSDKQPIEIEVPEGKHVMKVVKGGFVTHTQEFTLRPGIRVELEPVRLARRPPVKPPVEPERKPPAAGWAPLFNGKDLTG
jgi:predicted Ser/Thr protein kinase